MSTAYVCGAAQDEHVEKNRVKNDEKEAELSFFARCARAWREILRRRRNSAYWPIRSRSKIFPGARIEKLSAWVAPNLGVLCGLAEVSRAVLNSVPVFLMFKVRCVLK